MSARCCVICGRWGTREFRLAEAAEGRAGEDWVCSNDRACRQRTVRAGGRWPWLSAPASPHPGWAGVGRTVHAARWFGGTFLGEFPVTVVEHLPASVIVKDDKGTRTRYRLTRNRKYRLTPKRDGVRELRPGPQPRLTCEPGTGGINDACRFTADSWADAAHVLADGTEGMVLVCDAHSAPATGEVYDSDPHFDGVYVGDCQWMAEARAGDR